MLRLNTNRACPIGVDIGDDSLTLIQMAREMDGFHLLAADRIEYPADIRLGSVAWQIWAVEALVKSVAHGRFKGKNVIAAQPSGDVFFDTIRMPERAEDETQDAIINRLRPKLGTTPDNVLIRHVRNDNENIFVMASDKTKLYQHLAIFEKAKLKVKTISAWPIAVFQAYTNLWARQMGKDYPVMLLDIGKIRTRTVICDSTNLYFAYSSSVGATSLANDKMVDLLKSEMDIYRMRFKSIYRYTINRIVFVSGHSVDKDIYEKVAERAQMSAQIGDCLDSVKARRSDKADLRNRIPDASWITAMGLSLPEVQLVCGYRR